MVRSLTGSSDATVTAMTVRVSRSAEATTALPPYFLEHRRRPSEAPATTHGEFSEVGGSLGSWGGSYTTELPA